jgi:hypothetical protein
LAACWIPARREAESIGLMCCAWKKEVMNA